MKILITTSILPPEIGGPASYVPEIISRLGKDFSFRAITFTINPNPISKVLIFPISHKGGSLIRQTSLAIQILKNAFWANLIFAQDPTVVGLASVFVGKLLGKRTLIKFVGDPAWETAFGTGRTKKFLTDFLDQPDSGLGDKILIFVAKLSFNLVDQIITPSKFLANVVIEKYKISPHKVKVIYNSIEIPKIPERTYPKKDIYQVIYFGRLVAWKKIDEIIKAIEIVNQEKKVKAKLIIVGDGPDRKDLENLKSPFTQFLGKKSREETLKILGQSDLSVLNSVYEGLPHTVIETFSVGTPIVASDIPGTNEIAINKQTALTVAPGNVNKLAQAIEKLLLDRKLAATLTKHGYQLIAKQFNWETNIKLLKKVLTGCYTSCK